MCGITGFSFKDERILKHMTDRLSHRGPDQSGTHVDEHVSLGHRRLSILDLSEKGRQPMQNKDGSLIIVFNGEIYNYQEIKEELPEYKFTSTSDTEVILNAYDKWGTDAFKKFNGMWAFCIYDKKKQQLVLSRDRLGKKPLYYHYDGKRIIFASELKSILCHTIKTPLNKEAIDLYLSMGFIPSPHTIFETITKLEPRHTLIFDLKKKTLIKECYYELPKYKPEYNKKALIQEGRYLLQDATRLRMIADVPVGAFLSGGLDSTSVVASMAQYTELKNLHTFSIGFEGKYDETPYIDIAHKFVNTKHHHAYFTEADYEELLFAVNKFYDEPFGDDSLFPTLKLSALARKHVTVSLSGDGGDEIFGGYMNHKIAAQLQALKIMPTSMRKIIHRMIPDKPLNTLAGKVKEAFKLSLCKPEEFWAQIGGDQLYKPEAYTNWSTNKLKEVLEISNNNFVEAIIKYDLYYHTLADNFLVKVDRASMAHSLEIRSPYLDHRFIELSARIPTKWKVNPFNTKILLRDIIKPFVPKAILKRGKQGFTPPLAEWLKKPKYRALLKEALETLSNGTLDQNWTAFYSKILDDDMFIYDKPKIRLLLLYTWHKTWNDN
ncbi:asparagine synthase (glutamine-hydrolyzing) [Candidatus Woesearchaeota archaeon]|nr:asparagine synthase (glutamine-hydrolyzing) [Candidatus Woesearchaeota archaeon]